MEIYNVEVVKTIKEGSEHIEHKVIEADTEAEALQSVPKESLNPEGYANVTVRIAE
tara:strand:- start:28403 stop:28570 length:168 start_codon:yes stop_codon:yes gene_type:complete